jgi:hypothetical protein
MHTCVSGGRSNGVRAEKEWDVRGERKNVNARSKSSKIMTNCIMHTYLI